jgi:succinoglycan biosynthesis transport protein ExoP
MAFEIALPEDDNRTIGDYLDALKRRRKPALIIALSLLVLGSIAIFVWPNAYTSTAVILIEDPDIPPGLVPTTVTTIASKQIQYINQRVMTRSNLAGIIEKFNLFPEERKYLPTLLLVNDVEKDMSIDIIDVQQQGAGGQTITSTIAFRLGFESEDPQVARQVANELVSLYLAENTRARTEQTAETSQFMQAEVDRLDTEVKDLESQIAAIKRDNKGSLPDQNAFNMQLLNSLTNDIGEIDRQLQSLRENKIMLDAELAKLSPISTTVTPDGKPISSPEDQLKALQTEQSRLQGRYSAEHPDVQRVTRDLAAVRAQLGANIDLDQIEANLVEARLQLAKAEANYTPDSPQVQQARRRVEALEADAAKPRSLGVGSMEPDNPVYIQVRAQKEMLGSQERSLLTKQAGLRARRASIEEKMLASSDVEKDLSALYRRLQTATFSYQKARDSLVQAKMGQALETQSKGERFALVEPPDLPLLPSSPNRPVLLALLIVLVFAAGLGWPQVAESMDAAINSPRAIERVQGAPPIAEIPLIVNTEDRKRDRNVRVGALLIAPLIVGIILLLIHFLWIPLDILWYVGLRRLGM